ncbi:MAG: DUF1232 domain-containing protein [Armatimonadota bacterium]|nr:MAG: DUF1232 domain-containing protein [Armatimonadota bacterium]
MSSRDESPRGREGQSILSLIPRLAKFVYHLARDPRVPWTVKAALAGLAAYLACPIDIIPDWIPGAGYLDDVLLIGFVASYVLGKVPPEVVREHWGEDVHVLESLRRKRRKKE